MKRSVPRLHLVGPLDGIIAPENYAAVAARAAAGGVDAVHVRLPGAAGGDVLRIGQDVIDGLSDLPETTLFVNDRVDVAMIVNAGGVHLGERSMTVSHVRKLMGDDVLVGRSVHDLGGAAHAQADGADFVMAGHVYATDSKAGQPGRGVDWVTELAQAVTIPIIAIGGISVERVSSVIRAGAWGVAVGREILTAPDPTVVARAIREKIEQE